MPEATFCSLTRDEADPPDLCAEGEERVFSQKEIAEVLRRNPSTISRELV